jgi:DNA-binding response OmpR family regulator
MKILLIEDSERLRKSISKGLTHMGMTVDQAGDGEEGLNYALNQKYDVIVLDLMLPKIDGISVLKQLREQSIKTGILILSAKDQVDDRVLGLRVGADDYLIKPFSFDELEARIQTLGRRQYDQPNPVIKLEHIEVNTALHQVSYQSQQILLTPTEQTLLEYLAMNKGRVLSINMLEDRLYNSSTYASKNAIEAHISSLRKKIKSCGISHLIKTRRGFGYYIE